MSDPEDSVDSRTLSVGRKRAFEDTTESGEISDNRASADEAYQNTHKRARQDEGVNTDAAELRNVTDAVPTKVPHSQNSSRESSMQPSAQQITRSTGWNKGVQVNGGIRTSFGAKKASKFANRMEVASEEEGSSKQAQEIEADAPVTAESGVTLPESPQDPERMIIGKIDDVSSGVAQPHEGSSWTQDANKTGNPSISASNDSLPAGATEKTRTALDATTIQKTAKIAGSESTKAQKKKQKKAAKKLEGTPQEVNATSAVGSKLTKVQKKKKDREDFLKGVNTLKAINKFKSISETERSALAPAVRAFYEDLIDKQTKSKKSKQIKKSAPTSESEQAGSAESAVVNENDSGLVTDSTDTPGTEENPTVVAVLDSLSDRELQLQRKYFPTSDGVVRIARCLACTDVGHTTFECPLLSCPSCGEDSDHPGSSCPKSQRCGRCRELGHASINCPEKLARTEAEAVPCDLCGSSHHIESQCPLLWRSFLPKPEEILTIQSLYIDCYTCGQTGHFGPDCGLYQGIGSSTWSRTTFDQYVDPKSSNQAISAGVGVAIPIASKPLYSIKNTANNPIVLDDSEDDVSNFIHAKVNNVPKPKGHIQLGSIRAPSGPRRHYGGEVRSDFGQDSYAPVAPTRAPVESARYGRERSFSPPPRFDSQSDYVSFDARSSGDSFQDFARNALPRGQSKSARGGGRGSQGRGGPRGLPAKPPPSNRHGANSSRSAKPSKKRGRGGK